jgi:hypothetical protein
MHPPSLEITPPPGGGSASFGSLSGNPGDNAALAAALGAKLNLTGGTLTGLINFSGTTHAGVRLNNLTTTERNAIVSPQAGMTLWNTTTSRLNVHNGSAWTDGFVRLAGDTMTGPLGVAMGTIAGSAPMLNLSQTWNSGAATFTGILANITDTASNAASLLLNLQVGSVTQMSVNKAGTVTAATFRLTGNTGSGLILRDVGSGAVGINANGAQVIDLRSGAISLGTNDLGFGITPTSVQDIILCRDAANTFAQRNGTNAQTFRLYGTFTDASNHRRINLSMTTAGVAVLRAEGAGTGASGNVIHISSLPTSNPGPGILWNNAGTPAIGT